MTHGDYRASVRKIEPRVLTFTTDEGDVPLAVQSNCPRCTSGQTGYVLGEAGGDPLPLVHGWYTFQASIYCYVLQLNPENASNADPQRDGRIVAPCENLDFFVDGAKNDGILAVQFCGTSDVPTACNINAIDIEGLARVVRLDTVLSMAQTGENANLSSAPASRRCTPRR